MAGTAIVICLVDQTSGDSHYGDNTQWGNGDWETNGKAAYTSGQLNTTVANPGSIYI